MSNTFKLLAILLLVALVQCKKEVETKYITEIKEIVKDSSTHFIFVRHAEKEAGNNPKLTTAGKERAIELAKVLKEVDIDNVFSTNYNRTKATAEPTAKDKKLTTQIYSSHTQVLDNYIKNNPQKTALIVGHSNTVPKMLNHLLGNNKYPDLGENDYNNLYIVSYFAKGRVKIFALKYGK